MANISSTPYHDDFSAAKNYHKILFVPTRPIQSRELTQIQSVIQEQIKKHGDYIFQNGAMVIPGEISYLQNVTTITLQSTYEGLSVDNFIDEFKGQKLTGGTTNVKATVVHVEKSTPTTDPVLFITYISGGVDSDGMLYSKFTQNEVLTSETNKSVSIADVVGFSSIGSLAVINSGVYYINGYFVQNDAQSIAVNMSSSTPVSYKIGFEVVESIITVDDDLSLYDNSQGIVNETMQGADRLKITLQLSKRDYFSVTDDKDFIPLLWIKDNQLQNREKTTKLSQVGDLLARRTNDESGDYIVDPFNYESICYRSNNRGNWKTGIAYLKNDIVINDGKYLKALSDGVSGVTNPVAEYGEISDGNITWLIITQPEFNGGYHTPLDTETLEQNQANSLLGLIKISSGRAYIKGYEIDVIEGYRTVVFNKTREFTTTKESLVPISGQYFNVNFVMGMPKLNLDKYDILNFEDAIIGSCRIRNIEYVSGAAETAIYKLSVMDVIINPGYSFLQDARQISKTGLFSASVIGERKLLSGSVSNSINSATVTGDGSLFTVELKVGDTVAINGAMHRVTNIVDAVEMTVEPNIVDVHSNVPIYVDYSTLYGTPELYQQLPHDVIKTISNSDGNLDINYVVNRHYTAQSINGTITINLPSISESFISSNSSLYLVSKADGSGYAEAPTIEVTGLKNAQLTLSGLALNTQYNIIAAVNKHNIKEKTKTRKYKTIELNTLNSVSKTEILLTECDVQSIVKITQSGANEFDANNRSEVKVYEPLSESIITKYYVLDTNTNFSYYGPSMIVAQNGFIPSAPIRITYEYYDHTEGDYFSVDSQQDSLSNYLDFRSRLDDTGLGFDVDNGASVSEPLNTSHTIDLSYQYYLPRRDIIQLDPSGTFRVEEGVASLKPVAPLANDDNIIIAVSMLEPYTRNCKDTIKIIDVPMKRYTMRDIGKIADRLENVESSLSLNLSEQNILKTEVKDEFGLNRFKCGFIVDGFNSTNTGGVDNPDYKCAVDSIRNECRPQYVANDVKLLETGSQSRLLNEYQVTGEIVTLPYTSVPLMENRIATTPANITPLTHVRQLTGLLNLYPSYDTWINTEDHLPDIKTISEAPFNSQIQVANQLGILGTIWNAWQEVGRVTVNTVTNVSAVSNTVNTQSTTIDYSNRPTAGALGVATTTYTATTTTHTTTVVNGIDDVSQYRTGIETFAQEQWDQLGSTTGVVDQAWVPYAREKALVVYCQGMMPNKTISVELEQYEITQYLDTSTSLSFSSKTGTFLDYKKSSVSHDNLTYRQYGNNVYDVIEKSEVVQGKTSKATAIIVTTESNKLKVVNVKGTFTNGETVVGLTSGATAVITSVVKDFRQTSSVGTLYGIILIPSNNTIKFPSQVLNLIIKDSDNVVIASAKYDAHGIKTQKQTTIMSVKNSVIRQKDVSSTRVIQENWRTSNTVVTVAARSTYATAIVNCDCDCNCLCSGGFSGDAGSSGGDAGSGGDGGGDPLAQTFIHNDDAGVFLTKIELYFYSVKQDNAVPVIIQIRSVTNGSPDGTTLPFSNVVKFPSEIQTSKTSLVPTEFVFESPVYLKPNTEYALLVGSIFDYTNETKVWTSKMGQVDLTGQVVIKQPLMGTMFQSQTGSTWTADQMSDLCFKAYKANFDTTKTGHVKFIPQKLNYSLMETDPFKVASGSRECRVVHYNHSLKNNDFVKFESLLSQFNGIFKVSNVTIDSFTITLSSNAATTGWIGGAGNKIYCNQKYDLLYVNGNDMVLPNTHISYTFRPTENDNTMPVADYPIAIRQNIVVDSPKYLLAQENELAFDVDSSLYVDAYMYSSNPNVSPVIDLTTFSVHTISNRINNETTAVNQTIDLDTLMIGAPSGGVIFNSNGYFTISDATYFDEIQSIKIGKQIVFTGTTSNNKTFTVTNVTYNGSIYTVYLTGDIVTNETTSGSVTLKQYDLYTDSISARLTSNAFNYITKIVELKEAASGFRLMFDYVLPVNTYINVYYKTAIKSDYTDIATANWIKIDESFSATNGNFYKEKTIDRDINVYDQIMVKVEFKADNTSNPPTMRNFRLIALA